jgi:hypothetical protein
VPRETHTAEEIRKVPLLVPLPLLLMERDPMEGNANWHMPRFEAHRGNEMAIGLAIIDVKLRWDLRT